jgi:hypothetical protein
LAWEKKSMASGAMSSLEERVIHNIIVNVDTFFELIFYLTTRTPVPIY